MYPFYNKIFGTKAELLQHTVVIISVCLLFTGVQKQRGTYLRIKMCTQVCSHFLLDMSN